VSDYDWLYTDTHPDYFEVQRRDLWFYERLWSVLLRQLEKRTTGRWLIEFGSGPGNLLVLAKRRGWLPTGIEPSLLAREHARSLGARCFSSENRPIDDWWSAAIATEVLEHIDDPKATLLQWRDALVPGGHLALSVPNDNNPLQRLYGKALSLDGKTAKPWIHPTHKSYFNPKSLRELVESSGFEVVWQRTSFPVEFLLGLPLLSRHTAWKLSRLWPAPPFLWRLGVGRHCLVVARKT
jgi:SAM-dependent methyltransferase